jgi:hypothetical protein
MPTISANDSHNPETQDLSVRNIDGQPTANTIMVKMLDQLHRRFSRGEVNVRFGS